MYEAFCRALFARVHLYSSMRAIALAQATIFLAFAPRSLITFDARPQGTEIDTAIIVADRHIITYIALDCAACL